MERAEPPSKGICAAPFPASQAFPFPWFQLFGDGAGDGLVRGFSSCRSYPGESEKESECLLFTSHLNIHKSCELASYVTRAGLGRLSGALPHSSNSLVAVKGKINNAFCFGDNSFMQITFGNWQALGVCICKKHAGGCWEEEAVSGQVSKPICTIPGTMEDLKEEKSNPLQAWQSRTRA